MGKAIPFDYRVKIVDRLKEGEKVKALSKELGYSESGIKKIWYAYKNEGLKAFKNKYSNCGRSSIYGEEVRGLINEIRDNDQGGGYVRSKLGQKHPEKLIPSERTIQRWWVKEGTNRKKGRPLDVEKKVESNRS